MWSLWNSFEFQAYELLYKPFWILGLKVLLDLEPFKVLQLYRSWNPYVCCRASRDGFKTFIGDDFCGVLACLEKSALLFPMNVPFYFVCSIISFIIIASMNILLCYEMSMTVFNIYSWCTQTNSPRSMSFCLLAPASILDAYPCHLFSWWDIQQVSLIINFTSTSLAASLPKNHGKTFECQVSHSTWWRWSQGCHCCSSAYY